MALRALESLKKYRETTQSDEEREGQKFETWFKDVKAGEKVCDLVLMRHSKRYPGPTEWVNPLITKTSEAKVKISDFKELTPEGIRSAEAFGQHFTFYDRLFPYGSLEKRAQVTAKEVVKGAGKDTHFEAIAYPDTTYAELLKRNPDMGEGFKKIIAEANKARTDVPNWGLLDVRERARKGEEVEASAFDKIIDLKGGVEGISQMMSGNILTLQEKAQALLNGDLDKTAIPFVTHSLLNEGWLLKALRINGQPIKSLKELGGSFNPVEGFIIRFKKTVDGQTKIECRFANPKRQALFDGTEMTIDWEVVKALAAQYAGDSKPKEDKKEESKK